MQLGGIGVLAHLVVSAQLHRPPGAFGIGLTDHEHDGPVLADPLQEVGCAPTPQEAGVVGDHGGRRVAGAARVEHRDGPAP